MAVKSVGPASRPGSRHWRPTLQRGIDAVSEYADVAAQKLGAVSDPRARLLRKRRWALRFGVFFSFATAFWVFVTGLLAVWNTPVWALLITGLVAAGPQIALFSTGPGNSYVNTLAPTVKVTANPETAERLKETIDFDASDVFRGEAAPEAAAEALLDLVLDIASGTATWGEILDEGEEVISRLGPSL